MRDVLLLCPGPWDVLQLARSREQWADRYRLVCHGADVEDRLLAGTLDVLGFTDDALQRFRGRGLAGVTSSHDYPGCTVAAVLARAFDLPGADPAAIMTCSHKYAARQVQRAVAPEATPGFALVGPDGAWVAGSTLPPPFFVKPVKSWFSVLARRVDSLAELGAFVASPRVQAHLGSFSAPFDLLASRYARLPRGAGYLLAEELLTGQQVTLEGYVCDGRVEMLGVVDADMYPGTISFRRFAYPSSLPPAVQARMAALAERLMPALGFSHGLFNIELLYEPSTDRVGIVEVNPRMSAQFADLFELVDGTNSYTVLLALATGERPSVRRRAGRFGAAASFPLRVFRDQRVTRVPTAADIAAVQREYAVSLVKTPYTSGQWLSEIDTSDGASHLYAVVNRAGADHATVLADFAAVEQRLGFAFDDGDTPEAGRVPATSAGR